jgi:hypothetical protein
MALGQVPEGDEGHVEALHGHEVGELRQVIGAGPVGERTRIGRGAELT